MSAPQNPAQPAIDADVSTIGQVFTGLGTIFTDIQGELSNLPPSVDTTALDALAAQGQQVLAQFQTLDTSEPVDPTPAPDPTPTPDPAPVDDGS